MGRLGDIVRIRIISISIEEADGCTFDFLRLVSIQTGSDNRFCGEIPEEEIQSFRAPVTVQFSSDGSVQDFGFYLFFFIERDEEGSGDGPIPDPDPFLFLPDRQIFPTESVQIETTEIIQSTIESIESRNISDRIEDCFISGNRIRPGVVIRVSCNGTEIETDLVCTQFGIFNGNFPDCKKNRILIRKSIYILAGSAGLFSILLIHSFKL